MINFLETFKSYISDLFEEQRDLAAKDYQLGRLKDRLLALRALNEPADLSLALLRYVSEVCERSITFIVRTEELAGEKAIGVYAEKNAGPTSVTGLKIPLSKPSIFRDVIEKGQFFYAPTTDEVLGKHLFEMIGEPMSQIIILLPVKSAGKTVTLIYGDFGGSKPMPVQRDVLEILAIEAGLAIENALYRRKLNKTPDN